MSSTMIHGVGRDAALIVGRIRKRRSERTVASSAGEHGTRLMEKPDFSA
jgi:hypothetical protein